MIDDARVREAAAVLRRGGVVCFPTESFYGLAVIAGDEAAVARVIAAKRRAPEAPIACVADGVGQARALWQGMPEQAAALARAHWPGALTIVCPARAGLAAALCGPEGVGVRVPAHALVRALCAAAGSALTATSANVSGRPPATTVAGARAQLGDTVDYYLDDGETPGGAPSTIVAVTAAGELRLVRAGAVRLPELEKAE